MSEKVRNFVIVFSDILLRDGKQVDRPTASRMVDSLANTPIEMIIFEGRLESFTDYENSTTENSREIKRENGLRRIFVGDGNAS